MKTVSEMNKASKELSEALTKLERLRHRKMKLKELEMDMKSGNRTIDLTYKDRGYSNIPIGEFAGDCGRGILILALAEIDRQIMTICGLYGITLEEKKLDDQTT